MPARFEYRAGMSEPKEIPLTRGAVALVSAEDYEMASLYKWHLTSHGYAARNDYATGEHIYMHRFINRAPAGTEVDHIDRNKLNNTRENLRTATRHQQGANTTKQRGVSSQFKGVCFIMGKGEKRVDRWAAYISPNGKRKHLGYYVSELDAAFAYNLKAKELFGEFATLNPLPQDYLASHTEPELYVHRKHSKYRGVSKHKFGLWTATLTKDGKQVHATYHKTEIEAALAWNAAALQHHGESVRLNQI